MHVMVVADDLTGASAAAGCFAQRGVPCVVSCVAEAPDRAAHDEVVVVTSDSRRLDPQTARRRVEALVRSAGLDTLVAKRIDTTLRGNVGAEVDGAMASLAAAGQPVTALVVPAFPAIGRVTVTGRQLCQGVPLERAPIAADLHTARPSSRIADVLRRQTDRPIRHIDIGTVVGGMEDLEAALEVEEHVVICDALTDEHIDRIARAAAATAARRGVRWLPVDPGPFSVAFAFAIGAVAVPPIARPLLVVSGSTTDLTAAQLIQVECDLGAVFLDVDLSEPNLHPVVQAASELLADGGGEQVVGLRVKQPTTPGLADPGSRIGAVVRRILQGVQVGGLYLTGGDTAAAVLRGLDVHDLQVVGEVAPLAVAARIRGGPHDGLPVVTKGGLIGDPKTGVRCLRHLATATRS